MMTLIAASLLGQARRETAFVADRGGHALARRCSFFSAWNTSAPQRSASRKLGAPTGTIMNSCRSRLLSACAPPLITFIIGTGSCMRPAPPR